MKNLVNYDINEVHKYEINGIPLETGDLIFTIDGNPSPVIGQFWWIVGRLIPGDVDHIAIYIGPEGRCIEAGAVGKVIDFQVPSKKWNADAMLKDRGFVDEFYGVAYPLSGSNLSDEKKQQIRLDVAQYCLDQARDKKPYNLNFLDSDTEEAFYCSQLVYKAYIRHGINLNTEKEVPKIPFTKSIVFPQEVWATCKEKKPFFSM
ncbi:MAG: hypothetical protein MRK02_10295 [Candidatus Scalindua sp.]|nr:hypothetical protein [Candidatus Scalindua sp.]